MIFGLQYGLIVAGYAATAFLLGNYMIQYTGAREIDLGFIFMIQPAVIIVRPFICSLADRYQSHKKLYLNCSLISVLTHIPFILVPFIKQYYYRKHINDFQDGEEDDDEDDDDSIILFERTCFWLLVCCHFVGCICFCCMRTLGDVLTVNYCKRIGSTYTKYRKFGPISFGICSLILGYVNVSSGGARGTSLSAPVFSLGLPDYVPGFILYTLCHFALAILFYAWPDEFFVIISDSQLDANNDLKRLPTNRELWQHIKTKLNPARCLMSNTTCNRSTTTTKCIHCNHNHANKSKSKISCCEDRQLDEGSGGNCDGGGDDDYDERHRVNSKQQLAILFLLMRRDFRIPIFLIVLVFCGIVGHSIQNFVYVYLHSFCKMQAIESALKLDSSNGAQSFSGQCNASTISGYIMAGICLTETFAYMVVNRVSASKNKMAKIQLALFVLAGHYLVLAYLIEKSPYYFLIEALHGFEFGLMIATSIESGDFFANEVELIIPELLERNIVTKDDDLDLIRVSLVATMIACFLLVYDGLGGVIGSLMYGHVVNRFGYSAAFKLNAAMTILLFATILFGTIFAKHFHLKPRFIAKANHKINENYVSAP